MTMLTALVDEPYANDPGGSLRAFRLRAKCSRVQFGYALGYLGPHKTVFGVMKRYEENRREVPIYILRLAWFLADHVERCTALPDWVGVLETVEATNDQD